MSTNLVGSRALRIIRYLYVVAGTAMFLLLALVVVNSYMLTYYRVQGTSMLPTLADRQILFIDRLSYSINKPAVGDIVVLRYGGDSHITFVKRIVAVPGDSVTYQGKVVTLSQTSYFVEGDNRNHSTDSRVFGPIQSGQIVGKVLGRFPAGPN